MFLTAVFILFFTNCFIAQKPKFIILGFQKAATTSFQNYFTKIGLKSAHWCVNEGPVAYLIYKAKMEKRPLFYYLQSFDALTEMNFDSPYKNFFHCYYPQIDDFKQMVYENPNSVFILNSRNIAEQVKSMIKWGTAAAYLKFCKNKYIPKKSKSNDNVSVLLFKLISEHNENIRSFFTANPKFNFVDFSVEAADLTVLKTFLNLKPEFQNLTFPHDNHQRY